MARNARRNYVRDGRGRFASTPGGGPARKARPARTSFRQRQAVSLARQRGQTGRLGSATKAMKAKLAASRKKLATNASPQQKAAVTRAARMAAALAGQRRIQAGPQAGVIRGAAARGVKKALKGRPQPVNATPMGGRVPASQRPGSITSTLRGTLQALAKADAARIREIEGITGQPVRAPRKPAAGTGATVRAPGRRSVSGTLGDNLRSLAQSDARTAREMADLAKPTPKGTLKGGKGASRKRVKGGEVAPKALPERKGRSAKAVARTQKQRIAQYERVQAKLQEQIKKTNYNPSASPSSKFSREKEIGRIQRLSALRNRERTAAKWLLSTLKAKPKPPRPTSKVLPPGSRRKVRGPKMAGTIAKPKGLKPGALAERRGKKGARTASRQSTQRRSASRISFSDAATKRRFDRSGDFALYRYRENQAAALFGDKKARLKAGRSQVIRFLASNLNRQALKATPAQREKAYRSLQRFSTVKNPQPGGSFPRNRDSIAADEIKRLKESARQDGIGTNRDPRNRTKRKPRKP